MTGAAPPRKGLWDLLGRVHPALLLLVGSDESVDAHNGEGLRWSWLVLGLSGAVWGVILASIWSVASNLFSWYSGLPLMPTGAVLAAMLAGPFRRSFMAWSRWFSGETGESWQALWVVLLALALLGVAPRSQDWTTWMPPALAWVRPEVEYRVLTLMPMWGVWAMMAGVHFSVVSPGACRLAVGFRRHQPVPATAFWMALALAGTLWYFNFLGARAVIPAVTGLVVGSVGTTLLCRWRGGISREGLLSGNMATQIAFLLAYLVAKGA